MKTNIKTPFLLPALIAVLNLIPAGRVTAQTFTTLHSFTARSYPYSTNSDGAYPRAGLILSGNILYGTAGFGGSSDKGTVFAATTDGTGFTNLYSFTATDSNLRNSDGASPQAVLVLSGNTLFGTASEGGSSGNGTVFTVNTDGTSFTNLHSFPATTGPYPSTNSDGTIPSAGLVLSGNTLYGTAYEGGSSGNGTVFAVNTDGTGFTNLHSFPGSGEGGYPLGGLILSSNTLYGTSSGGGSVSDGRGTVFAVHTDGSGFTNLHSFTALSPYFPPNPQTNSDGAYPYAGLILSGNTLYGTAYFGGSSGNGTAFAVQTDGSGFTNLHSFAASVSNTNSDGANPYAPLILSGNTLYGTAVKGGSSGQGTVFSVHTDGTGFMNLHSFTATLGSYPVFTNSDGASPRSELILLGNTLYGTAYGGGNSGNGTVFSLSFRPQLTITPAGTNVILSWPISFAGFSYAGYHLQQSQDLSSPTNWSVPSPDLPVFVNGQLTVTKPMSGPQLSYRLVQ